MFLEKLVISAGFFGFKCFGEAFGRRYAGFVRVRQREGLLGFSVMHGYLAAFVMRVSVSS